MIPKRAIELAIEGEWRPEINTAIYSYTYDDLVAWFNNSHKSLELHAFADLTFWQALGKALGWVDWIWKPVAEDFYNKILTGGNTEKFWEEILTNK